MAGSRACGAGPQSHQGPRILPAHHSSWTVTVASAPTLIPTFQAVRWEKGEEGSLLSFKETSWKSAPFLFKSHWPRLGTWPHLTARDTGHGVRARAWATNGVPGKEGRGREGKEGRR